MSGFLMWVSVALCLDLSQPCTAAQARLGVCLLAVSFPVGCHQLEGRAGTSILFIIQLSVFDVSLELSA